MLLLLVLVKESNSRRGGDYSRRGSRAIVSHGGDGLDDKYVLVWLTADDKGEERIKNLDQELVILLQALRRNVKNLILALKFLSTASVTPSAAVRLFHKHQQQLRPPHHSTASSLQPLA